MLFRSKKANPNEYQDDNDLVAGSADITNKADIVIKYSRCDPDKYGCDSLIKVTKNRIVGKLRISNEDAVRVCYSSASKRIVSLKDMETNRGEKVYGWERMMMERAEQNRAAVSAEDGTGSAEIIPDTVTDLSDLPF